MILLREGTLELRADFDISLSNHQSEFAECLHPFRELDLVPDGHVSVERTVVETLEIPF